MILSDDKSLKFWRRSLTNSGIIKATEQDENIKKVKTYKINESKYKE